MWTTPHGNLIDFCKYNIQKTIFNKTRIHLNPATWSNPTKCVLAGAVPRWIMSMNLHKKTCYDFKSTEQQLISVFTISIRKWIQQFFKTDEQCYKSRRAGLGCPPAGKSCNIARQRGPLGSETSTGPCLTASYHEIHHFYDHARHLGPAQSFLYGFSGWPRCNPMKQTDEFLYHKRREPKRTHISRDMDDQPSQNYI